MSFVEVQYLMSDPLKKIYLYITDNSEMSDRLKYIKFFERIRSPNYVGQASEKMTYHLSKYIFINRTTLSIDNNILYLGPEKI